MLRATRAKGASYFVWILLGLLIIGLTGFGITTSGSSGARSVGSVGKTPIDLREYLRVLESQVNRYSQIAGKQLSMEEARALGIDRIVIDQLVGQTALRAEADRIGISVGDATVHERLMAMEQFAGSDGRFDNNIYSYALENARIKPEEYDEIIRHEATQGILTNAVTAGIGWPSKGAETLVSYLGERRDLQLVRLAPSEADAPATEDEGAIRAVYDAEPERFTLPLTRRATIAYANVESLAAGIVPEDAALQAAFEERASEFGKPERRILDRLAFPTMEEAEAARARIDAGETTLVALAGERGLSETDIDQGEVSALDLSAAAREAVFGTDGTGLVGPVQTSIGPALFMVHAILAPVEVAFEEVRDQLATDLAAEEAASKLAGIDEQVADLVAAGATPEELKAEAGLAVESFDVTAEGGDGIAADPAVIAQVFTTTPGQVSDPVLLSGGGVAVIRVDEEIPARLQPYEDVRDEAAAIWRSEAIAKAVLARADVLAEAVRAGETALDGDGRSVESAPSIRRDGAGGNLTPELVEKAFAAEAGDVFTATDGEGAILARLEAIAPIDLEGDEGRAALARIRSQTARLVAEDVLGLYVDAIEAREGVKLDAAVLGSVTTQAAQ